MPPRPNPETRRHLTESHLVIHLGEETLCRLERLFNRTEELRKIMATLDEVLAVVTEEDTKTDSLIALMDGMKQQLADALSGVTLPPAVQAKVDKIFSTARANVDQINTALDANTADEPELEPEPEPVE